MFDGLRERLADVTEDVEEDLDEDAIEDEAVAEPDDEAAASAENEAAAGGESSGDDGAPRAAEPAAEDEARTAEPAAEDEARTAEPAAEDEARTDEGAADAEGDRSLGDRAKLFASGRTVIDEDDLEAHLDDLEIALLASDVEMSVAGEILEGVEASLVGETRRRLSSTGSLARDALGEALYDVISVGQFDLVEAIDETERPVVIVFTGVNGVGKTTTIAKLSQHLDARGLSSVLANGDTYRAGANEQLAEHADALDQKLIAHEQGSDPAAVIYDAVEYAEANDVDVVLGDTAGRLHTSDDLMAQLAKIDRVVEPDFTVFVDEAVAGQDAVNRAREFADATGIDGTVLTKADADAQGGAAISIAHVTGEPILFLGTGQGYDDLERFEPETMVDRLLGD